MKGVWGKILKIDLTSKNAEAVEVPGDVYGKYGAGLGIGAYCLYREIPEKANPLGPDNAMIISPGLLVGTGVPTGSKTVLAFKSPLTGGAGRSVAGAHLGVALRKSGFDAIVIKGVSESLTAIKIDDEDVEFIDASEYKGVDSLEVQKSLREKHGKGFRTCAIGRAGENLSKIADVDFEDRQAGRGGGGAVLGSKNVKAILVKGTKKIDIHDPEKLKALNKKWIKILKEHPATKAKLASLDLLDVVEEKYGAGI
jgi:aldehyde:ferredoxin oxidoreductase